MNPYARGANQYFETQVRSSSPLELVVLLYDAAIRAGQQAREAMVKRDIATRSVSISKMMAIVGELQNTLDMERGGDVARELDRIYDWSTSRLVDATQKQDPAPIDEVVKVMGMLRDAWQTIARQPAGAAAR
ncbi:MAG TPA: flagellar export chaperone FliS [Vicinamibacterales bacterium]|jgi:flagellar protein FliS|nr:flagellar export chaperone FliS [Vicinamibacterales bacterium]